MKTFIQSIITIIMALILMMATTLLLDLQFIQRHLSRQIIVYIILTVIAFVGVRLLKGINSIEKKTP